MDLDILQVVDVSSGSAEAIHEVLDRRMSATRKLMTTFVQSSGKVDVSLLQERLYQNYEKVQSEVCFFRSLPPRAASNHHSVCRITFRACIVAIEAA
jgi:hypothetical protein